VIPADTPPKVTWIPLTGPGAWGKLPDVAQISESMLIDQVVERLAARYTDVAPERVADVVHNAHARFEQSPIREFVPLLVERRARAELSRDSELLVSAS
jgi:hypothetical protein